MSATSSALLDLAGVHAGYGKVTVLEDVSLRVPAGSIVTLVGANGAGKSTLLRTISGLIHPTRGRIAFDGREIGGHSAARVVRAGLGHVAEGRRLFRTQTVDANLDLGLYGAKVDKREEAERLDWVCELFPVLRAKRAQPAGVLSGGEQQMLAIAQVLLGRPQLIMLDEPSLGLAPILVEQVMETLVRLRAEGITVLLVEQIVELALEIANHAYVMRNGRVIADGPAAELAGSDVVREAYLGPAAGLAP